MSVVGVRKHLLDAVIDAGGRLGLEAWRSVVAYAEEGILTRHELRALVDLAASLSRTRLAAAGLTPSTVEVEAEVVAAMEALARRHGLRVDLGGARVTGAEPSEPAEPVVADVEAARAALDAALAQGKDLGDHGEWQVHTPGADVRFSSEAFGRRFPALVMRRPTVGDPDPRDLLAAHRARFDAATDLAALRAAVMEVFDAERAWLDATEVTEGSVNRRYAIQNLRRSRFLLALRDLAVARPSLGLPVNALLVELRDERISGRDYEMEVGSHTNYWPYDDGYLEVVEKVLEQEAPGSDGARAIANRVADILRRKTVFDGGRTVDERDAERTLGAVLTWRPPFAEGAAPRVSLAAGADRHAPRYELLQVAGSGLPPEHAALAGAPVYRDEAGKLRFDRTTAHPDRAGDLLPAALVDRVEAREVPVEELGLRRPLPGEPLRRDFPFDWTDDGSISVADIDIGWWGHCHNEAPANALGIDPQKPVAVYRADRGVPVEKAAAVYRAEDVWDAVGALTSDHEGTVIRDARTGRVSSPGYVYYSSGGGYAATEVDETSFVGNRNNGGHWFQVTPARAGARRVRVDAEVLELWGLQDPTVRYAEPMNRFRRDLENPDGTFDPNPDWVESGMSDDDVIAVDAAGRRMRVRTRFITLDERGRRVERTLEVDLDPAEDTFVKLAEEVEREDAGGGGRLVEFWYNPATREVREVGVQLSAADGFKRKETGTRTEKAGAVTMAQETTYDSVAEIDEFVASEMGLPFVFDTSAGQAVWNYPVEYVRRDVEKRTTRVEGGTVFTFTTYRLRFRTMGGPAGDTRYILKRDPMGRVVRALALRPMPDFAFRLDHWVCAGVVTDAGGRAALNLRGLTAGYLTDRTGQKLVTELWERLVTLVYAALSESTPKEGAWLFETVAGALYSFGSEADWKAAVAADTRLRALGG